MTPTPIHFPDGVADRPPAPAAYGDWKAPPHDGAVMVWPPHPVLIARLHADADYLAKCDADVLGRPLMAWRREVRSSLGIGDGERLILTGHQAEMYHPGVWVKNVLADALAGAVAGGRAMHVTVGTDAPKHLALRWPGESHPITDDPALLDAAWSARLRPPTPGQVNRLVAAWEGGGRDAAYGPTLVPAWLKALSSGVGAGDLPAALASAFDLTDVDLGVVCPRLPLTPLLGHASYVAFVYDVCRRADAYAVAYNRALAEYRRATGTTSPRRPMPDLTVSADSVELPFWTDDLATGRRTRTTLTRDAVGGYALTLSGERFTFEPLPDAERGVAALSAWLEAIGHRLSPRALTLTTFLRSFAADTFIHGIGGGRYDQVTDRMLRGFHGVEPPGFVVTTATLFAPEAVGRQRVCLPCLVSQGHRLRHAALRARKGRFLDAIDRAPRRSMRRRLLFESMRRQLDAAAEMDDRVIDWRVRMDSGLRRVAEEPTVFDRELPYVVQPRVRLEGLIGRVRASSGV